MNEYNPEDDPDESPAAPMGQYVEDHPQDDDVPEDEEDGDDE